MNQKLLQASGLQKNIHISLDTRYNTSGMRNSRRTGLPIATQSTTLVMEKQTGKNYRVSAFTQNKLCPKGALLRSKGDQTATCPGGHTGCITNVDKLKSLSMKADVKLAGTLQVLVLLLHTEQQMETRACTRVLRNSYGKPIHHLK